MSKPSPEIHALLDRYRNCLYEISLVTPETAEEWLARCPRFGKGAVGELAELDRKVDAYARLMTAKAWPLNGDAIVFDERGDLVDGMARLMACVRSGEPFATIVFFGVPDEAARTLGSHARRTAADVLDINGEQNPRTLAHSWPVVIAYLNSESRHAYRKPTTMPATASEMLDLTERYPLMRESAALARESGAGGVISESVAVASHFIMAQADRAKADAFIRNLGDPTLDDSSAAATLNARAGNLGTVPQTYRFALVAKAWNRYRSGARIGASGLVFNGHVGTRVLGSEAFPVFQGVPANLRIDLSGIVGAGDYRQKRYDAAAIVDAESPARLEIEWITVEMAREFLLRNGPVGSKGNRRLRREHVARLARDMKARRWIFNAQPLKFGKSGHLLDGQHRCHAAIEADTGFLSFIVRDLDDDVFSTYDSGASKNFGKHLKDVGTHNATALSATVGLLHRVMTNSGEIITPGEGFELLDAHPDLGESVLRGNLKAVRDYLPPSVAAVCHYLFNKKSPEETDRFFADLTSGANLKDGDAMLPLRAALTLPSMKTQFPKPEQKTKITIQAWNARRKGKTLRRFSIGAGYPEIL